RTRRALAQPGELADCANKRTLVTAAEQGRQHIRSLFDEGGLVAGTEHAGKFIKGAELLRGSVGKLLRTARLRGHFAETSQQRRYGCVDGGLRNAAIKSEREGDTPDHLRREESRYDVEQVDGHGNSSSCPLLPAQKSVHALRVETIGLWSNAVVRL